jgi:hypothetical protein
MDRLWLPICDVPRYVRFSTDSDHLSDIAAGLKWANKGHCDPKFLNAILPKADHAAINGFDFRR